MTDTELLDGLQTKMLNTDPVNVIEAWITILEYWPPLNKSCGLRQAIERFLEHGEHK